MTLQENRFPRIFTLCALYVAQGIPWGFVAITLVAWLADRGLQSSDVAQITVLSTLPWSFKWIWGPVIDRYGFAPMGRRRPWILFAQLMMAATILAMVAIPDLGEEVGVLAWMIFVHNVFNSLQDVSVDALAVDLLPEEERGKANGLMYGSKYLGGAIGGAGMATVVGAAGLQAALLMQAAALGLIFLLPLFLRERPGERLLPWTAGEASPETEAQRSESVLAVFRALFKAFSFRSSLLTAGLALTMTISSGILAVVGVVFIVQELGWSDTQYAQITGGPGLVCGLVGAVLGGFIAERLGHRRTIALGCLLLAALWLGFAAAKPYWDSHALVTGLILLDSFAISMAAVGFFALAMGVSWPAVAATQFTAYMALSNLSSALGGWLGGVLDGPLSVRAIYVVCGLLQVGVVLILLGIDVGQVRRELGESAAPPAVPEPGDTA